MIIETYNENGKTLQEIMEQFLILHYNKDLERKKYDKH